MLPKRERERDVFAEKSDREKLNRLRDRFKGSYFCVCKTRNVEDFQLSYFLHTIEFISFKSLVAMGIGGEREERMS